MPSDETRRLLRAFGVAVTTFEDAIDRGAAADEITAAEAEVDSRLLELTTLLDGLRAKKTR